MKNTFLFARTKSIMTSNPIRMCDTLRHFRSNLILTAEELFTGNRLSKHVATVLMNFVGHVIEVHSSFYRLPQGTIQVTKTGKLLTAFNNETIGKYSGKSLDEISLDEGDSSSPFHVE
ncbi:hypothetical protein MAR_019350, partial [Mya arenaria]